MKRRQLLMTGTIGISTALSGCGSLGGDDGTPTPTGPAEFDDVSLTASESATVDSALTLTVAATNVGGETGTYEGVVQLGTGSDEASDDSEGTPSFEESFSIEGVASGETGETDIEGPTFDVVDDYEFTIVDTDVSSTVRPAPKKASVGETLAVGEDLSVSVDDVALQESVFYPTSRSSGLSTYEEIGAFGAPSGHILAVVTVSAENTGTETTSAAPGKIGIKGAEWYGDGGETPSQLLGRSDSRFYDGALPEIEPSETLTGYYLAKVPRDAARGTIEITAQIDENGTLPERVWAAEPDGDERSLPKLTLESVTAPEKTALGRDYEITATVANEGDGTGTLRSVLQWDDEGTWAQLTAATSETDLETERSTNGVITSRIEPGASTEITISSFSTFNGHYTYRLQPFGDEWRVNFEEAVLSMGDRLKSQGNANVVVADLRTEDTITVYDDWQGEETEAEPDDGNQFVAVQFQFAKRDESRDYVSTPDTNDFDILADGNDVGDSTYIGDEIRESWYEPIAGELDEQPELTGWDIYEAPAEYATGELAVRFEESPGFGSSVKTAATWNQ
ncbi:hypothetical protein [Haloparvum sp. AD34]